MHLHSLANQAPSNKTRDQSLIVFAEREMSYQLAPTNPPFYDVGTMVLNVVRHHINSFEMTHCWLVPKQNNSRATYYIYKAHFHLILAKSGSTHLDSSSIDRYRF